jgi:hypothetical protein
MGPEWEKVKKDKRLHNAKIKVIDADVNINNNSKHPSARDVSTKGVPTIYLIEGNNMTEYNGGRTKEEIVTFALDNKSMSGGKKKRSVHMKRTKRVKRKGKNTRKRPARKRRKTKTNRRTKK